MDGFYDCLQSQFGLTSYDAINKTIKNFFFML